MKENELNKLKSVFISNGGLKMYYLTDAGYDWAGISVTDKTVDIFPKYAGKISAVKSRVKVVVETIDGSNGKKDCITVKNAGKQGFEYSFGCKYNSEKITVYKNPFKESDEIL